jgi:hypothetical protein
MARVFDGTKRSLTGERALLAAVIGRATDDAVAGCPDARSYFAGHLYRHHLAWLDLDDSMLPAVFANGQNGRTGTHTDK